MSATDTADADVIPASVIELLSNAICQKCLCDGAMCCYVEGARLIAYCARCGTDADWLDLEGEAALVRAEQRRREEA